jgi:hypothetical protein
MSFGVTCPHGDSSLCIERHIAGESDESEALIA